MIIITLCGLLALSIEGTLTDAAMLRGSQNLQKSRSSEVDVVHFLDNPLSHYVIRDLKDEYRPTMMDDGSMILRGVRYDKNCLSSLGNQVVGSVYPRFEDCRTYMVQTKYNHLSIKSCPRNSIFDPSTSTCIIFNKLKFIPYSCLQECPDDDEEISETEDLEESVPDLICNNYNSDGTMRETRDCVSVFGDPKYLRRRSSRMLDSLPTESVEASTQSGSDYSRNYFQGTMPRLNKPRLEEELAEDQNMEILESGSEGSTTKVFTNKRNSNTFTSDSLIKSRATKRPTRNTISKKPVGKTTNPLKLIQYSDMNEVSGDGLNYSSGEEYLEFSELDYDITID